VTGSRSASIGVWSEFRLQLNQGTPLALGTVVSAVFSYLALTISARSLGVAEFGVLGATLAVVSVAVVAMRPLHTAATHLAARVRSDRLILSGLTGPLLGASFAIACVVAVVVNVLDAPLRALLRVEDSRLLWLAAPLIGLHLFWQLESGLIAGTQRFDLLATDSVADALVRAIVMAPLAIALGAFGSVAAYATGVAAAGTLAAAQLGGLRWSLPRHVFDRDLLQVGGGSILLTLAVTMVQNLDLLFLRAYGDPQAVGWYAACATIGSFLLAVTAPLYLPLYPRALRATEERMPTLPILASVLLPFTAAGVVAVGASWGAGNFAAALFFGPQFAPAGDVLPAYVTKTLCIGALFIVGQYALATRRALAIVPGALLAMAGLVVIPITRFESQPLALLCASLAGAASILTLTFIALYSSSRR
jgi:O-antigen/teichoic acid export membrane protein